MSQAQAADFTINPNTTTGTQLATLLDRLHDAGITAHSGVARPAYAKPGTVWLDTSTTPGVLKLWNGTADVILHGAGLNVPSLKVTTGAGTTESLTVQAAAGQTHNSLQILDDSGNFQSGFVSDGSLRIGLSGNLGADGPTIRGVSAHGAGATWMVSPGRVLDRPSAGSWFLGNFTMWQGQNTIGMVSVLDSFPGRTVNGGFGFMVQAQSGLTATAPIAGLRAHPTHSVDGAEVGSLYLRRSNSANFWDLSLNQNATSGLLVASYNNTAIAYLDTTTKNWTSISDKRLKKEIRYDDVPDVLNLKPASFHYGTDLEHERRLFGFVAQDVLEIHDNLVLDDGSEQHFLSLDTTQIIAMLVKTVKDQEKLIGDLSARIDALEAVSKP